MAQRKWNIVDNYPDEIGRLVIVVRGLNGENFYVPRPHAITLRNSLNELDRLREQVKKLKGHSNDT